MVGSRLVENAALQKELKRQGSRTATARSEVEAMARLAGTTPDLAPSEFSLGRSDGASFVQSTRALAGTEGLPIVLLDEVARENRRAAARAVGAAGYVILPPEISRVVTRLGHLLDEPKERRFTRYPDRLSARLQGLNTPCVATEVGRGGVFIATEVAVDLHRAMSCRIALPGLGRDLHLEGEVLYRTQIQGAPLGLGLHFAEISPEDEANLIVYLMQLERKR